MKMSIMKTLMKTLSRGFLALAMLLVTVAAAEAQPARVVISVTNADGEPIEGAKVTAENPSIGFEETKETSKRGRLKMAFLDPTVRYQLTITAEGYQGRKTVIKPAIGGTERFEYELQKLGQQAAGPTEGDEAPEVKRSYTPAQIVFNSGVESYQAGDLDAAKSKFLEALDMDPTLVAAHSALATIYLENEQYEEALASAQALAAAEPENPRGFRLIFEAHRGLGNDDAADDALDKLGRLERGTDDALFMFNEGTEALKVGDLETGRERMESALKLKPDLEPAMKALAIAYINLEEYELAAKMAESYLEVQPRDPTILKLRLDAYRALGDEEKIQEAFEAAAAVDPTVLVRAYVTSAQEAFDAGNPAQAIADARSALEIDPDQPRAHFILGLSLVNQEQTEEAKTHLQRFLELAPNDPEAETAKSMLQYL